MFILELILFLLLLLILAFIRSLILENSSKQKAFIKGRLPSKLQGFYPGTALITGPWLGKSFNPESSSGINVISSNGDRKNVFPFKTEEGISLTNKNLKVLKIDYDIKENPFWVRIVLDELVETSSGNYLGKAYLRLMPNFPLSVMFFKLTK